MSSRVTRVFLCFFETSTGKQAPTLRKILDYHVTHQAVLNCLLVNMTCYKRGDPCVPFVYPRVPNRHYDLLFLPIKYACVTVTHNEYKVQLFINDDPVMEPLSFFLYMPKVSFSWAKCIHCIQIILLIMINRSLQYFNCRPN